MEGKVSGAVVPAQLEDGARVALYLDLARQMQVMRVKTAKIFPRDVFRDSAWDMMLELFVAGLERRIMCVKQLILASGETATSALRRIDRLADADLLRRASDPVDHRRVSVELTVRGYGAMEAMLDNLFFAADDPRAAKPRSFRPAIVPVPTGDAG